MENRSFQGIEVINIYWGIIQDKVKEKEERIERADEESYQIAEL